MGSKTHSYSRYSPSNEMAHCIKIWIFVTWWNIRLALLEQAYVNCAMVSCPEPLTEWLLLKITLPTFTWLPLHAQIVPEMVHFSVTIGWENTD